jgi:hypothetical protein
MSGVEASENTSSSPRLKIQYCLESIMIQKNCPYSLFQLLKISQKILKKSHKHSRTTCKT